MIYVAYFPKIFYLRDTANKHRKWTTNGKHWRKKKDKERSTFNHELIITIEG